MAKQYKDEVNFENGDVMVVWSCFSFLNIALGDRGCHGELFSEIEKVIA